MKQCKCKPGHDVIYFTNGFRVKWVCKTCNSAWDDEHPIECDSCGAKDSFEKRELRTGPVCYCFTCKTYFSPCDE
jgi:rubrerythrin